MASHFFEIRGDTMNRRPWLKFASVAVLCAATPPLRAQPDAAARSPLRSLAVLDFELVDEQNNPLTKAAQEVRLRNATLQLQRELAEYKLYRVVDTAPAQGLQRTLASQQAFLYRCDDCADQVGRLLGVDLVMATWVQKVSELILNLNVEVYDTKAQKVVFSKSVDMRGNEDQSWTRAVHYLVRDMAEKRERNPRYGQ
jgi:muconolactone delta-isomerase